MIDSSKQLSYIHFNCSDLNIRDEREVNGRLIWLALSDCPNEAESRTRRLVGVLLA